MRKRLPMINLLRRNLGPSKRVGLFLLATALAFGIFELIPRSHAADPQPLRINRAATNSRTIAANVNAPAGATYTWVGGTPVVTTDWTIPTNWTPNRLTPAATDNLVFDGSSTPSPTVTNIPTQTIATLSLVNGVLATFNAASGGATLTISGATGSDLSIPAGTSLTLATANALSIALTSGSKGVAAGGSLLLTDGAHTVSAADANGITFQSGSNFTTGNGFSGNPFGTGTDGSVVFQSGSFAFFNAGSDPFGGTGHSVATFNLGSTQSFFNSAPFSSSGRVYGNLMLDGGQTYSGSGTGLVTVFNDFTLKNGSSLTLSSSAGGDLNLLGSFTDENSSGTAFTANSRAVKFQGGGNTQLVTTAGNDTFSDVIISKIGGSVKLGGTLTINGALQFNGTNSAVDVLDLNQQTLNLNGTVGGTSSSASNGFKGDATAATLNIGGIGALGTLKFVSGSQTLKSLSINRTSSGTVTVGTNLTIGNASAGSLTLTNGVVDMGSNTLSLASFPTITRTNGYVIGNLQKTFGGTGPFTFTVGTANGYSPVDANVTAGTGNSLTVKAVQGQQPNISGNALLRYWTLSNSGSVTADLTFHYPLADVFGTEANYKFLKYNGSFTQFTPSAVGVNSPQDHFATLSGVNSFSDWTLADPATVFGTFRFENAPYSTLEGNSGTHDVTITVSRTGGSNGMVSVHYATSDGTATIADNDYVASSGDLTWANADMADKTFTVTVKGDTTYEANETVNLTLSNPQGGATLGAPSTTTLTILNDDPPPTILTVNTTDDVDNGFCLASHCSLREAINAANLKPDTNTISFSIPGGDPGCTGAVCTISLATALPDLATDMTITGSGANVLTIKRSTVGGTPNFRIFTINGGPTATISGLTIANGKATDSGNVTGFGGGILDNSTGIVNVIECSVSNNSSDLKGGGIANIGGTLTLTNSTVSGNTSIGGGGGGISNDRTLNLINSTVSGNTGNNGAGIANGSTLTLTNSTVSGNTARTGFIGGGIANMAGGIGTLRNTIVAGNFGNSGTTPDDINPTVDASSSFNLIGTGGAGGLSNGVNNNQVGVSNPRLGALANNGGPTQTHALLPGSPAIDAGSNANLPPDTFDLNGDANTAEPLPVDQRGVGFNRSVDGNGDGTATVDIGAYEVQSILVTNTNDSGAGSLRQAITDANANADTNAVNFQAGLTGTIALLSVLPDLSTSMSINGPTSSVTVSGRNIMRIFNVAAGAVTISNLALTSGRVSGGNGAAILNSSNGTITVASSIFTNNRAINGGGGAIASTFGGTLNIINSTFAGNVATVGGAIHQDGGGTLNITNCTITSNTANGDVGGGPGGVQGIGGGISNFGGTFNLRNSIVSRNAVFPSQLNPDIVGVGPNIDDHNLIGGDPKFGPFQDNGGPTRTFALLPGSPAINAGSNAAAKDQNNNALTTDQRGTGFPRVVNTTVDIGAVEVSYGISATAGTPQSTVIGNQFATQLQAKVIESGNPVSGVTVTFTAPSSGASGTFPVNSLTASVNTDGGGMATAPTFTANGKAGSYNVTASLAGGSPATTFALTNTPATTSTSVASSVNPSDFGQSVTFTATVTSAMGTPTGMVQFTDGANNLGSANCVAGGGNSCTAQFSTSSLSAGTHNITATYSGDANFLGSVGTLASAQLVQPSLSINDVSITEGDSGTKTMNFTVTLSAASNLIVTANFATADGTATAGSDYVSTNGTLTFNPGETTKTIGVTINGDTAFESNETFFVNLTNPVNTTISKAQGKGTILNDDAQGGIISFSQSTYSVNENAGFVTITVNRTGDTSGPATVDYATGDDSDATSPAPCVPPSGGIASSRCDFTTAIGKLSFAAGDKAKSFAVLINQDSYIEGPEAFTITLSNLTGGAVFAAPSTATVTINDVQPPASPANVIDIADIFVRLHYHDFLNREADTPGLNFWTNEITSCGSNAQCTELKRISVSGAFYISIEFQQTGYLVERLYKASYGDANGTSTLGGAHQLSVPIVRFIEFMPDTQQIGQGVVVGQGDWQTMLENNKKAFTEEFVQRKRFTDKYPSQTSPTAYVNQLFANGGVTPSDADRNTAIGRFGGATTISDPVARARALRDVAENSILNQQEFNRAFVLMEYSGYLRRNPNSSPDSDYTGYEFWLTKLNAFNGDFIKAEMVKAFISSGEYRKRFGP